jgi:DNA polymerase V
MNRSYIAIDLKSFYASVECVERRLDPLATNLVVADPSRTEKTICLAVSPSLKAYGISGRARLFEVVQKVKEVNAARLREAPGKAFSGTSFHDAELKSSPDLSVDYIVAPPRMALYIQYSTRIYNVYLKYIAPEDIHVYSIDEVLIDATDYLNTYNLSARELATEMILDVLKTTGVTAAAGIGTNLYLAKIAMDIRAGRDELPPPLMVTPAPDRLLARWQGICQKAGGTWPPHDGRYCKMLSRKPYRLPQRGFIV